MYSHKDTNFLCSVYLGTEGVNIYADSKEFLHLLRKRGLYSYIPGWHVSFSKDRKNIRSTLYLRSSDTAAIRLKKRFALVTGKTEELSYGDTIPYLIQYLTERERMKRSRFTIHGAAVAKDGNGILILGKQGSGKTSVAITLCREYGYNLVGNDLVTIGTEGNVGHLYNGTKVFRLRMSTIKHYNRDLRRFFLTSTKGKDEWTTTASIRPVALGIGIQKSPVPIKKIVYVHLMNDPESILLATTPDLLFSRVYLHQNFSAYIKGAMITPLIGKSLNYCGYLPSLDNQRFHNARKKLIDWIIGNPNYKYVSGPMKRICEDIDGTK